MKKKDQVIAYYPVLLNISGRKCVVVGGGQVALRKHLRDYRLLKLQSENLILKKYILQEI